MLTRAEPNKRVRSAAYLEDASSDDSPSPSPTTSSQLTIETSHRNTTGAQREIPQKPTLTTPLLMPPPSTRMSTLRHHLSLQRHYLDSWARRNRQALYITLKAVIFVVKMLSLTRPCTPLAMKEIVLWPLMFLAGLELLLGSAISWGGVAFLGAVHALVLGTVLQFGGGPCLKGRELSWG